MSEWQDSGDCLAPPATSVDWNVLDQCCNFPPPGPSSQPPRLPGSQPRAVAFIPPFYLHHHLMTCRRCEIPEAQLCGLLLKGWLPTLAPASPFGGSDTQPFFPIRPAGPTQGAEGFFWELKREEEPGEATEAQAWVVCSVPVVQAWLQAGIQAGLQVARLRNTGMTKGKETANKAMFIQPSVLGVRPAGDLPLSTRKSSENSVLSKKEARQTRLA